MVSDTGIGIPAENQSQMFQKFYQASNNEMARDSSKSTGLGLYATQLMADGMGSKIELVSSRVGHGSTFSFKLDIATPQRLAHLKTQLNEIEEGVQHTNVDDHVSATLANN